MIDADVCPTSWELSTAFPSKSLLCVRQCAQMESTGSFCFTGQHLAYYLIVCFKWTQSIISGLGQIHVAVTNLRSLSHAEVLRLHLAELQQRKGALGLLKYLWILSGWWFQIFNVQPYSGGGSRLPSIFSWKVMGKSILKASTTATGWEDRQVSLPIVCLGLL